MRVSSLKCFCYVERYDWSTSGPKFSCQYLHLNKYSRLSQHQVVCLSSRGQSKLKTTWFTCTAFSIFFPFFLQKRQDFQVSNLRAMEKFISLSNGSNFFPRFTLVITLLPVLLNCVANCRKHLQIEPHCPNGSTNRTNSSLVLTLHDLYQL